MEVSGNSPTYENFFACHKVSSAAKKMFLISEGLLSFANYFFDMTKHVSFHHQTRPHLTLVIKS